MDNTEIQLEKADHDTLAQWLRVARKNDWSATPLQDDTL
jgi:hypothetical protein